MSRSALFILALAVAPACGGRPPVASPPGASALELELDRRAELLVVRGRWDDARAVLERGLAEVRARGDRAGEARLVLRRGQLRSDETRHRGGDRGPARADLEAAQALARATGDPLLIAAADDALGMHRFVGWFSTQDPAELGAADQLFARALAVRAPRGDSAALADSAFHVGLVHQMRGELPAAAEAFERAYAVATRVHDALRVSYAARHLGYLAELRHDGAAAEARYRESLELRAQLGAGPGVVAAQITLAELRYSRDGDTAAAVHQLTGARDAADQLGSAAYVAIASAAIARVERDAGRAAEAVRLLGAAIAAMDAIHSDEDVPEAYEQIALIELLRGEPAAALTAVERGLARRRTPRLEALQALARARTGHAEAAAPATDVPEPATDDPIVVARRALAAGDPTGALAAALRGDEPDTLLLAARAAGDAPRAIAAARAISHAQGQRFERVLQAATPIALADARAVFAEAAALCGADHGALWGVSLCGPLMVVDRETRFVVANQADARGVLRAEAGVFSGTMPADANIANTATTWAGVHWVQLGWPLPADRGARATLLAHEMFHRIGDQVAPPAPHPGDSVHLDTTDGRTTLQLEWRALAAALRATTEAARRAAIGDALAFRRARRLAVAGAAATEDALERNEGLAEYTGVVLGGAGPAERIAGALHDLAAHVDDPSFVRSFAYATGPAYGLLLDRYAPAWRAAIARTPSLGDALAAAVSVAAPDPATAATRYGGAALRRAEQAREAERAAKLAAYRAALIEGPVLRLGSRHMNIELNPQTVTPLDAVGSVYPTLRVVDAWGVLEVTRGALIVTDWSAVVVPAPAPPAATSGRVTGPGWTLALAPGWRLVADARAGDFRLSDAPP